MKILGVIPARYASSRFNGKPLELICGKPMIEWVYKRSVKSELDDVVVATDDKRIFDTVAAFGGKAVMTRDDHVNGTSRIQEVIGLEEYKDFEFIINIQGDEPIIDPESINILVNKYKAEKAEIITLKEEIKCSSDKENPNVVKVITDFSDNALYFSRSLIPYMRNEDSSFIYYRHVGIYGYTSAVLNSMDNMKDGKLEHIESLEQLRFLENGYKIKVYETKSTVKGVDTKEDLLEVEEIIRKNNISL
ncbi:3-deoxy-manno-octulosonate cytidylyltransferase [Sebaldella sp. S0638]|uniref:3-deoxy-manno-octulosonate cytidylyltransferase n=1 Tax=Sebaldella sp. S0638 TaxID=2957809 RepID=UPI00209EFF37|nr:3-deoxy-manno-octulosonate cytidylyltransferase [Sebaldella sp. S0638]MCP1223441.1 3-deoxy-manno-octulosonate cytidylyltransferase [Sebaldella sp. S0638]